MCIRDRIREIAKNSGYENLVKKSESYEICFVPDNDYRNFLKNRVENLNDKVGKGNYIDENGSVIGEHEGYPFYTIGQRKGLGLALGYPAYVTKIDSKKNEVTIGSFDELKRDGMYVNKLNFIFKGTKMVNNNPTNKKKVLMVQGLHEEGKKLLLERDDIEPITIMSANENEIMEAAKEVHGITVRTANISRKIIENSKNLLIVSRHGVGYDSIDVDALNDSNIPLAIAAHSNMISVAEHAMFMLLALSKNVFYYDSFARKADWTTRWDIRAWDVAEKNLLVIGFGRIGSRLVKRALAFDMNVYVYDPYVNAEEIKKSGAVLVDNFLDILSQMDAVSSVSYTHLRAPRDRG